MNVDVDADLVSSTLTHSAYISINITYNGCQRQPIYDPLSYHLPLHHSSTRGECEQRYVQIKKTLCVGSIENGSTFKKTSKMTILAVFFQHNSAILKKTVDISAF